MNFFFKNVLKIFLKKKIFKLVLGFASVGAFLNIVGYSAYVFITSLGGEPKKTMTILLIELAEKKLLVAEKKCCSKMSAKKLIFYQTLLLD